MILSLIVALSENGVIGKDGDLPWHLPADLKRVKRLTTGHTLIMGRKTFDSIGRPLPNRRSIVLTRDPSWRHDGVDVAHDFASAVVLAEDAAETEAFVFGGAAVFTEALPRADRLHVTRVHTTIDGDVYFPHWDIGAWRLLSEKRYAADDRHAHAYSFQTYERR